MQSFAHIVVHKTKIHCGLLHSAQTQATSCHITEHTSGLAALRAYKKLTSGRKKLCCNEVYVKKNPTEYFKRIFFMLLVIAQTITASVLRNMLQFKGNGASGETRTLTP